MSEPSGDEQPIQAGPTHAGQAVVARDTGRVLMLQRTMDPEDPCAGMWEFPGGSIEDGETPEEGAAREWCEETGLVLPGDAETIDSWDSADGIYRCFVIVINAEADMDINPAHAERTIANPDDPNGDATEVTAWFNPADLPSMPALRPEVLDTPWEKLNVGASDNPANPIPPDVTPAAAKAAVIVALPHAEDPVHAMGPEQAHMTMCYLAPPNPEEKGRLHQAIAAEAATGEPFAAKVTGRGQLGKDNADVLHLDPDHAAKHRAYLMDNPTVKQAMAGAEQFPDWQPHLTLGYPDKGETTSAETPDEIQFDRLALWHGDDQTEYPLGGNMTAAAPDAPPAPAERPASIEVGAPIPWHGVLITEGIESGDHRTMAKGSLTSRNLPLPMSFQKSSAPQHQGGVVSAVIHKMGRIEGEGDAPNQIIGTGVFRQTPEADEAIGLATDLGGRLGVSADLDSATAELALDEAGDPTGAVFTQARVASACMLAIPAFAEAWIALGPPPPEWDALLSEHGLNPQPVDSAVDDPATDPVAAGADVTTLDRGPGWVTNPQATRRIHAYWTEPGQPGYAKIGWGTEGDFDRCRAEVGEEIGENSPEKLRFLNQICAQWQHDAIGVWPGKGEKLASEGPALNVNLVASAAIDPRWVPDAAWFSDLHLEQLTRTTFVEHDNGTEVYGHWAEKDTCHLAFDKVCVSMPRGLNYDFFHSTGGGVLTTDGLVECGLITLGGGHASTQLGWRAALAHYDDASSVVVYARVGEDEFGGWFHGWLLPSCSDEQRVKLRNAKLSGDWRAMRGGQSLLLVHAVNVGGFMLTPQTSVVGGRQLGLVAAGVLRDDVPAGSGVPDLEAIVAAGVEQGIRTYRQSEEARGRIRETVSALGLDPASRIARVREQMDVDA